MPSIDIASIQGEVLATLLQSSIVITLLLMIAFGSIVLLRTKSSASKHLILVTTLLVGLLLPLVGLIVPKWGVALSEPNSTSRSAQASESKTHEELILNREAPKSDKAFTEDSSEDLTSVASVPVIEPIASTFTSTSTKPSPTVPHSRNWMTMARSWIGPLLSIVWANGVAISFLSIVRGIVFRRRLLKNSKPRLEPEWLTLLEELKVKLCVHRKVQLRSASDEWIPMTWGTMTPTILLPESAEQWTAARRELVLLHELAHIKRFDFLSQVLSRLACAVYWFHPLVWIANGQARRLREFASDDVVITGGGKRASAYAKELMQLAHCYRVTGLAVELNHGSKTELEHRVCGLFDHQRSHQPMSRSGASGMLILALMFGLVAGSFGILQAEIRSDLIAGRSRPSTNRSGIQDDVQLPENAIAQIGSRAFRNPGSVTNVKFSPNGENLATISGNGVILWDKETGNRIWQTTSELRPFRGLIPSAQAYCVDYLEFSRDGSKIYTPGDPGSLQVWATDIGEASDFQVDFDGDKTPVVERPFRSIDVSPKDGRFALGNSQGLIVCDQDGKELYRVENHPEVRLELADDDDRLKFHGDYSYGQFSPDGERLAVVTSDDPKGITILDAATGRKQIRIPLTDRCVRLTFSPDSRSVITTERDVAIRCYSQMGTESWSKVYEPIGRTECYTTDLKVSPDGDFVVAGSHVGSDDFIHVLDIATGKEVGSPLRTHSRVWALDFDRTSGNLCSAGWSTLIQLWNVETRKEIYPGGAVRASAVCDLSSDGKTVSFVDADGIVHHRELENARDLRLFESKGIIWSAVQYSPDQSKIAAGGFTKDEIHLILWDLSNGKELHHWNWKKGNDPNASINSLSFSPDGSRIAEASFRQDRAKVFDTASGEELLELDHSYIFGLSFGQTRDDVFTTGWDRTLRKWNLESGEAVETKSFEPFEDRSSDLRAYEVAISADRKSIATLHLGGDVRVWDANDLTLRNAFHLESRPVYGAISMSSDGSLIAVGAMSGSVTVWNAADGKLVKELGKHEAYVYRIAIDNNNTMLLSGGEDGRCIVWDLKNIERDER